MQFSPSFTQNYIVGGITMRGPVSSSAWAFANNNIQGTVSIGSSAINNAEKLVSGLTLSTNTIAGTLSIVANREFLTSSANISTNTINGNATLTLASSSITFTNNIIADTGFTFTNNFYSGSIGLGAGRANRNLIIGQSNTMLATGISDAVVTQVAFDNNIIGGISNTLFINATSASTSNQLNNTIIYGNTLIVTGSSNTSTTFGGAFFGRYNSNDGRRNSTAGTIFAVGTGTAAGARKTGFLIDSGSNTFVEGTFNVSGSSTFTGSLNGLNLTQGPGKNNTGLGSNVLQNAVSGGNVALGTNSLFTNTSGTDNVALGDSSLFANISGNRNMAIGSNTLEDNTTGTLNVAIGNATLASLVDGNANIGIGFESLKNQTTGDNNTAIGRQTLNQNISGSGNIALGASAGYNETGSNNFYLTNNNFSSINADRSGSLMWGKMDNTTANQTLQINAKTNVTNELLLTRGSNKQSDIVSVNGSATISNSLVTSNSIILVTTQNGLVGTDEYPAVVSNKGTGTFDINHNYAGALDVGYLIINN
jgi:hypothetical protein